MRADSGVTVTITLSKRQAFPFKPWEIIVVNDKHYNLIYFVEGKDDGATTVSLHPLNISRWKIIRYFELKILRKVLNPKTNK